MADQLRTIPLKKNKTLHTHSIPYKRDTHTHTHTQINMCT